MYREHGATSRRCKERDLEIGAPAEVHAVGMAVISGLIDQVVHLVFVAVVLAVNRRGEAGEVDEQWVPVSS